MPFIQPTTDQLTEFAEAAGDGPVHMLNLLRLDGDEGRRKYKAYMAAVKPILESFGGELSFLASCGPALIGPDVGLESWDLVLIGKYPSRSVLLEMLASQEYRSVAHLRSDALLDSRLLPMTPV